MQLTLVYRPGGGKKKKRQCKFFSCFCGYLACAPHVTFCQCDVGSLLLFSHKQYLKKEEGEANIASNSPQPVRVATAFAACGATLKLNNTNLFWTLGDGGSVLTSATNLLHTYESAGAYAVSLTVTSRSDGAIVFTSTAQILVYGTPSPLSSTKKIEQM